MEIDVEACRCQRRQELRDAETHARAFFRKRQ
jgi:hypothetical protein